MRFASIRVYSRPKTFRRNPEQGFALLFIFVLLAGIAVAMLMQLPRVAFESQREREEMLIERGEQYQRAIGLYVKQIKRYPAKIEDLESTNNLRFLRRRYVDPMTGKDDWRLIHVGPGGQLLDSLVKKAPQNPLGKDGKPGDPQNPQSAQNSQNSQSGQSSMNADPNNTVGTNNGPPEVNQAVKARPSDQVGMAGLVAPPNPYGYPQPPYSQSAPMVGQPNQQYMQGQPVQQYGTGQPGYDPNNPQHVAQQPASMIPGQQPGYGVQYVQPGQPGQPVQPGQAQPYPQQQPYPQGQPYIQGQPVYGQPAQTGLPQYQPGQVPVVQPGQTGYPPQPGQPVYQYQPGQPQPGQPVYQPQQGQPYNPMQNMPGVIRPPQGQVMQPGLPQYPQSPGVPSGGMLPAGSTPQGQATAQQMIQNILMNPRQPPQTSAFNNQGFGGGIAGVATKYKSPSIKIYAERQKYQEWEFIYDPKKDPVLNPSIATGGAPPGSTASPTGSSLGSSTGSSSSSANGSSFGSSGSSFGSSGSSFGSSSGSSAFSNGQSTQPPTSPGLGGR
jgi:uncharacterized membrane protein YgcG